MLELLIRPTGLDVGLMRKILTPIGARNPADLVIHPRLVLDAVTAVGHPRFADIARVAGVPMLIDPDASTCRTINTPPTSGLGCHSPDRRC